MKNVTLCVLGLVALNTVTATLRAQSAGTNLYSTDFYTDSTGYTFVNNSPINGQGGWYNSGNNNTPGSGAVINNPSGWADGMGGTQANAFVLGGAFGGIVPGNEDTYPSSNPTQVNQAGGGISTMGNSIFIHAAFTLYGSTGATPNDNFGFALFSTSGYDLMDINFAYAGTASNGFSQYNIGAVSWANDSTTAFQPLYKSNSVPVLPLQASTIYNLGFEIYQIGTTNQSVSIWSYQANGVYTNVPYFIGNTLIAGTDFSASAYNDGNTNIGSFAPSWWLYDGGTATGTNGNAIATNFGNNAMVLSSVAVSLPEPKTWILFGLSGLALVVYLRKRDA